jgi:hypothetical protein
MIIKNSKGIINMDNVDFIKPKDSDYNILEFIFSSGHSVEVDLKGLDYKDFLDYIDFCMENDYKVCDFDNKQYDRHHKYILTYKGVPIEELQEKYDREILEKTYQEYIKNLDTFNDMEEEILNRFKKENFKNT